MTPQQPIKVFGSKDKVAEICDITPTGVSMWAKRGGIPYDKQCLLEVEARRRGKRGLLADKRHAPKKRTNGHTAA